MRPRINPAFRAPHDSALTWIAWLLLTLGVLGIAWSTLREVRRQERLQQQENER